mmetsp:Transcript_23590/g.49132  ORF Transcript_23590/g.49132 Transcript_23590/m.49132 type:complete len:522 (+) Transcript_23590:162-1727(+)|eukprot:CAMPEP_0118646244 /NCGR_PEP_ID=MMETSP0785-20121206/7948_1 /TAXON_ID=91992 /ORGANISM="Bolidomonas pacifica, Strain CCMP 1866" /LENGTH=521 /DNA_ID=CAMNT_0006538215 /DNA_START=80 /DNA_END=1645 /DNA_ORIENTATION=+
MPNNENDDIAVIDEELIQHALVDSADPSAGGAISLAAMVSEATSLRLSFKNIKKIDNLAGFENLTSLCLDNNVIDSICNISHLTQLKWLDLSFNNISVIEGLETCTQLMDISLFNNQIETVQGLDECKELQCLSLGNNKINSLDICQYLRKFKKLNLINLEGNPVCREPEYKAQLLAFLPKIKYLDYALIHASDVANAREQYQDELQDAEEQELIEADKAKRDATAAQETAMLEAANLTVTQTIFDDFFREDTEYNKLQHLPQINDIVEDLQNAINTQSEELKDKGLSLQKEKEEEIEKFEKALESVRAKGASVSIKKIEDFARQKKRVFREIEVNDASLMTAQPLLDELKNLYDELMDMEMQQVQQFQELLDQFENAYGYLKQQCAEQTTNYFKAIQEAEEKYHEDVTKLANELLTKNGEGELPEGLTEDAKNLLVDRDALLASISSSHDIHVSKAYSAESIMEEREKHNAEAIVKKYTDDAATRNRSRIMELYKFVEDSKASILMILNQKTQEEEDEYE